MKTYKITWPDGNVTITGMNATLDEARHYFMGQIFNFGDTDAHTADNLMSAVSVIEIS